MKAIRSIDRVLWGNSIAPVSWQGPLNKKQAKEDFNWQKLLVTMILVASAGNIQKRKAKKTYTIKNQSHKNVC